MSANSHCCHFVCWISRLLFYVLIVTVVLNALIFTVITLCAHCSWIATLGADCHFVWYRMALNCHFVCWLARNYHFVCCQLALNCHLVCWLALNCHYMLLPNACFAVQVSLQFDPERRSPLCADIAMHYVRKTDCMFQFVLWLFYPERSPLCADIVIPHYVSKTDFMCRFVLGSFYPERSPLYGVPT